MTSLALFDTSIASDNLGDQIIMEAVRAEVAALFPQVVCADFPTHVPLNGKQMRDIQAYELALVGGTNLLCANWLCRPQWKLRPWQIASMPPTVLFGVGWQFYSRPTQWFTAWLLRRLLAGRYVHSVRDSYTQQRLAAVGVQNVLNTGCPTMWGLTREHCADIPAQRSEDALITLTSYRHNYEQDRAWVQAVQAQYRTVYFWPQMADDVRYVQQLNVAPVTLLEPSLAAYDALLASQPVDVIGTRLHGGIRALQKNRRSLILEVDNRATEIARDTHLPTIQRGDLEGLLRWIQQPTPTELTMPWDAITRWKAQFL